MTTAHKPTIPRIGPDINPIARTLVVCSGSEGSGVSTLAVSISDAVRLQGNRVCLIESNGDGEQAERTPSCIEVPKVSHIGSQLASFLFEKRAHQVELLTRLQRLEKASDYLFIDASAAGGEHLLPLLLAAPQLVLVVTPTSSSHNAAFTLLKSLRRHYFDRPIYVILNKVPNLPTAHDSFRQLRRATMKYLQVEIRYLGYMLADKQIPQGSSSKSLPSSNQASQQCLAAISRRILQLMPPHPVNERFSDYFSALLGEAEDLDGSPKKAIHQWNHNKLTAKCSSLSEDEGMNGLRTASRYAALLGQRS